MKSFAKPTFFKLPSGRTLRMKKNVVHQAPGIHKRIFDLLKQCAMSYNLPKTGYHGFIVFDEMTIQVTLN